MNTLREDFEAAAPRLQAALDAAGNTHSLDDMWALIERGDAQLWHTDEFSGVTEILMYPRKKAIRIWLVGGELGPLLEQAKEGGLIHRFAQAIEADMIEILGRKGWVRALAPYGFAEQSAFLVKEVSHE